MGIPRDRRRGLQQGHARVGAGAAGDGRARRARRIAAGLHPPVGQGDRRPAARGDAGRARAGSHGQGDPRLDPASPAAATGDRPRERSALRAHARRSRPGVSRDTGTQARAAPAQACLAAGRAEEDDPDPGARRMSATTTSPLRITPDGALRELTDLQRKLAEGSKRLGAFTEEDLAIATTPVDEVYREDMMRLYKCRPTAAKQKGIAVLIVYALVGRYQMIDLEVDRSFVRKLLAEGIDVYYVDWGKPTRAQRWLTIDDYVSGYLDNCVDVVCAHEGIDKVNLMGICQGGVFSTC